MLRPYIFFGRVLKRPRFANSGHAHVNAADGVPGSKICNTGLRQAENALEDADAFGSTRSVDSVYIQGRKCRVVLGDAVYLALQLADFVAGSTDSQVVTREGAWHAGNLFRGSDVHILAVIITNNFNGTVAFVTQEFGAPLAEAVAGNPLAIAIGGKNRLGDAGACQIVIKYLVYQIGNVFINISAVHKFLVIGCGGSNGKVVSLISIR